MKRGSKTVLPSNANPSMNIKRLDAAKVRFRNVLRPRKTTIDYLYDFGDCWEHRLTVTDIRTGDPDLL